MHQLFLFFLGIIVTTISPLSPVHSMDTPGDLIFTVQDKTGHPFTVRPMVERDYLQVTELEKDHMALTTSSPIFLRPDISETTPPLSYLYRFIQEEVGYIVYTHWVVVNTEGKIVGDFNYDNNEGSSLIHPALRGNGLGAAVNTAIHAYFFKQLGKPYFQLTPRETEKEELEPPVFQSNYDDFKREMFSRFNIEKVPYTGFIGDVSHNNIGSLRMCLATGLTVQGIDYHMIRFVFPPSPETEDKPLRALVERLVSKEESDRLAAQQNFEQHYLIKSDSAAAAAATTS